VSRKNPVLDQQEFGRLDQGVAAFPLQEGNVDATGLLRLSGASLVSVVESPHLRNRNDVALFRLLDRSGLRGVFAQG
jgi:hypothetical protein